MSQSKSELGGWTDRLAGRKVILDRQTSKESSEQVAHRFEQYSEMETAALFSRLVMQQAGLSHATFSS